jgi:hypothetical protein
VARTNLPLTKLVANSGVLNPSATTVDQTNGMNVALASESIPAGANSDRLVLKVDNTAAAAHNVIVRAGAANPPAFRAGIGDITFSVTNAESAYVGPFEWARVAQSDGSVNVDFDSGFTGTITAFLLPRSF